MTTSNMTRRLAAIVAADVAGFSRLMGRDEEATLGALRALRTQVIEPSVATHGGRIVKTAGDGFLIEFYSVVDAVRCWIAVQHEISARNEDVAEDRRLAFRVGVNLGDIIVDGTDIFGDGVNVAARLEALAAPGGICVSKSVVDQVRQALAVEFEDMGPQALKNIDRPIHAYRVARILTDKTGTGASAPRRFDVELPDRPSIAVLPFRNLNRNPEVDFVADGISLGIQTLLVQLPGLFLINAVSHEQYRNDTQTAAEALQGLPVRYALEGSVQCMGQRARVDVQIADLSTGEMVWAERYDRDLEDVFALQDDITREVTTSLNVRFFRQDLDRVLTQELSGDGAWEYFLRGVSHLYRFTKADNERARHMFEKLHALRPDHVHGSSYLALSHWIDATRGWAASREESLRLAGEWAEKAVTYDELESDGIGQVVLSYVRLYQDRHDEALALCEKAVGMRSNCPAALGQMATVHLYCGNADKAVRSARESLAVRTMCPPVTINLLADAYRESGDIDLSIMAAKEAARRDPKYVDALATLCRDYLAAGDTDQARRVAADILELDPKFSVDAFAGRHPYKDKSAIEKLAADLRSAGLPS